jgi:hypothetical protein
LAFPIETALGAAEPLFVYSPLQGEWTIAVQSDGTWFDRATGKEIQRPTHWMPLPQPQPDS